MKPIGYELAEDWFVETDYNADGVRITCPSGEEFCVSAETARELREAIRLLLGDEE